MAVPLGFLKEFDFEIFRVARDDFERFDFAFGPAVEAGASGEAQDHAFLYQLGRNASRHRDLGRSIDWPTTDRDRALAFVLNLVSYDFVVALLLDRNFAGGNR